MISFRLVLSAVILWGMSVSCSNDINVYSDDAPEMMFVLGCLDGTGTLQQVKIRKMISGNEDARLMVNDPAHYLPDTSIRVYLEESSGDRYPLNRVIHPPQTGGVVAQDSNLMYEVAGYRPPPGQPCFLRIEDPANGKEISARATSLMPAAFAYPDQKSVLRAKYNFTDARVPFRVFYGMAPASILTVSIKYVDFMVDGDMICRKANYSLPPSFIPHPSGGQTFPLNYMYQIFNRSIQKINGLDYRMFYRFDFTVWTGDSTIANYLYVAERFSDNRRQFFNNINGGQGLFFATSSVRLHDVCPQEKFLSFLALNDTTAHLNFSRYLYSGIYVDPDSLLQNPFFSGLR